MGKQFIGFYNWIYNFFDLTGKEIDDMPKTNRNDLELFMTKIVNDDNEIDAIVAFDGKDGTKLVSSRGVGIQRGAKSLEEKSESIAGSLTRINSVKGAITEFSQTSGRGDLKYSIFQLENGILIVYFLEINGKDTNIAFISSTPEGLGLMLRHTERNIDRIRDMLLDIV
jgi:hypothetical protein